MQIFQVVFLCRRPDGSEDLFAKIIVAPSLVAMNEKALSIAKELMTSKGFTEFKVNVFPVDVPLLRKVLQDERLNHRTFDDWLTDKKKAFAMIAGERTEISG